MEKWQTQYISHALPDLMDVVICSQAFLRILVADGILSNPDITQINSVSNPQDKISNLFDILVTRVNFYEKTLDALRRTKQTGAIAILEKGYENVGLKPPLPQENLMQTTTASVIQQQEAPHTQPKPQAVQNQGFKNSRIPMGVPVFDDSKLFQEPEGQDRVDFKDSMNPLEVAVVKPKRRMTFEDDQYGLSENFKGFALVLNITEFQDTHLNRNGAKHDTHYMTQLWSSLGYEVTCEEGYFSFSKVERILEDFKSKFCDGLPTPSSCVIFIGSHGQFSTIETSDNESINLYKHIIYKFDSNQCPQLRGKPKIFFIQACQRFESDAVPLKDELENPIDDAIVCFSTIPGFVSRRDTYLGTWYTYCLTKVIMEDAHRMDLLRMLKKTQETMRKIITNAPDGQLSTFLDMGIKTLYFNMSPE